jgi:hypothetical protein
MSELSSAFDVLLVGLAGLLRQHRAYPYPPMFVRATHQLALHLTSASFPHMLDGLFRLFARPVQEWCPYPIPREFDPAAGLVDDRRLSEEASYYFYNELLERAQLQQTAPSLIQQIAIENYQFQQLLDRLYAADDPVRAQQEYVLLRSFLIDQSHATTAQLRDTFWAARYVPVDEVGGLYDEWPKHLPCWTCDHCGPLTERHGQLRGAKPSACNDHRVGLPYVRRIQWERGLRRIKIGIHWRVCLPGIPEIRLHQSLTSLRDAHPEQLLAVHLWPGIDRYDLQLRFSDSSIWAVDIKDIREPTMLGPKLVPLYHEGELRYDEGFYVVPSRRVQRHEGYLDAALAEASQLPRNIHLVSEAAFRARVMDKLKSLQPRRAA